MRLPDVNVLLYAIDESAPAHPQARDWWNASLSGTETVGLAWSVLLAFVRLTTNPRIFREPLEPDAALDYLDRWLALDITTVVEPTPRHPALLRDLLASVGTGGNLVADAHLAALAIEHGAEIWSADRDFGRFAGVRWRDPLEP